MRFTDGRDTAPLSHARASSLKRTEIRWVSRQIWQRRRRVETGETNKSTCKSYPIENRRAREEEITEEKKKGPDESSINQIWDEPHKSQKVHGEKKETNGGWRGMMNRFGGETPEWAIDGRPLELGMVTSRKGERSIFPTFLKQLRGLEKQSWCHLQHQGFGERAPPPLLNSKRNVQRRQLWTKYGPSRGPGTS